MPAFFRYSESERKDLKRKNANLNFHSFQSIINEQNVLSSLALFLNYFNKFDICWISRVLYFNVFLKFINILFISKKIIACDKLLS